MAPRDSASADEPSVPSNAQTKRRVDAAIAASAALRAAFPDLEWLSLFEVIVHRAPVGIIVFRLANPDDLASFTLVYANPAAGTLTDRDLSAAVGAPMPIAFPRTFASDIPRRCAEVIASGKPHDFGEILRPPDRGPAAWLAARAFPLGDDTVGVSLVDVTERRMQERSLRRQERFLGAVLENLPNMVFVKDSTDLRFLRVNKALEDLLGVSREELLGRNDHDFFPPEEATFFETKDRAVLASGRLMDIPEEPIHSRAHGLRWLHTKKIPVHDEAGRALYLIGISEDITDARAAREALEKKTSELERSNAELEQFAYVASHDLQEPLRKVLAFSDRLRTTLGDALPPAATDYIARMTGATRRMQVLIDDLLAFSRVATTGKPMVDVDLEALLREVVSDLEHRIERSGGKVVIDAVPRVVADPLQMRQLFQNLLGNALKFARPDAPPVVRVRGRIVPPHPSDGGPAMAEIFVEDNGIGFDSQHAEKIFLPFQRLHGHAEYEGTGMGLAICRKIVARHGGAIHAKSAAGVGSTFVVTLPLAPTEAPR